jgi:hypothetical protein
MKKNDSLNADCCILALSRQSSGSAQRKDTKKAKPKGFAAKLAANLEDDSSGSSTSEGGVTSSGGPFQLPPGTEVALFVAPGPKELSIIEKLCTQVGMITLIILLNACLSKITKFGTEALRNYSQKTLNPKSSSTTNYMLFLSLLFSFLLSLLLQSLLLLQFFLFENSETGGVKMHLTDQIIGHDKIRYLPCLDTYMMV